MPIFKSSPSVPILFVLAASVLVSPQAVACYTVYNKANVAVYASVSPPIDMSYQIHERLPAVFPGGHLVFDNSNDCATIDARVTAPELSNAVTVAGPTRSSGSRRDRKMGQ